MRDGCEGAMAQARDGALALGREGCGNGARRVSSSEIWREERTESGRLAFAHWLCSKYVASASPLGGPIALPFRHRPFPATNRVAPGSDSDHQLLRSSRARNVQCAACTRGHVRSGPLWRECRCRDWLYLLTPPQRPFTARIARSRVNPHPWS